MQHGNRKQDAPNCVQFYIAEYNVTSEVAIANISQMMEDAWKTKKKTRPEVKTAPAALQIRRRTFSPGRENP